MLDGLARRWGCPPWVIAEGPAWALRLVRVVELGTPQEGGE